MSTREQLYTETLRSLDGYPGAQKYAQLCCKLPNFYMHAARHEMAYEVLVDLAHTLKVPREPHIPAPVLMWRIAQVWRADPFIEKYRETMDTLLANVAMRLLEHVTSTQQRLPH